MPTAGTGKKESCINFKFPEKLLLNRKMLPSQGSIFSEFYKYRVNISIIF